MNIETTQFLPLCHVVCPFVYYFIEEDKGEKESIATW